MDNLRRRGLSSVAISVLYSLCWLGIESVGQYSFFFFYCCCRVGQHFCVMKFFPLDGETCPKTKMQIIVVLIRLFGWYVYGL